MKRGAKGARPAAGSVARAGAPGEDELAHVLRFATLEEAEETLRRIDALWREARAAGGAAGAKRASDVVEIARQGLRRAQMIAGNRRVAAEKRAEKEEIRQWFRVWLQTPELFFDWLELRKQSAEFAGRFGSREAGT